MIDLYKTLLYTSNIAVSRTGSYYTFYLQSRPGKQSEIKKTVIHLAVYITDMIQDAYVTNKTHVPHSLYPALCLEQNQLQTIFNCERLPSSHVWQDPKTQTIIQSYQDHTCPSHTAWSYSSVPNRSWLLSCFNRSVISLWYLFLPWTSVFFLVMAYQHHFGCQFMAGRMKILSQSILESFEFYPNRTVPF